jgi:hypothetical protein
MIDVEVFTVCEYASDMGGGSLLIAKTFEALQFPNLPATFGFFVAIKIRVAQSDHGTLPIVLKIIDPDGNEIQKIEANLPIAYQPNYDSTTAGVSANLAGSQFTVYGKHIVSLSIRGQELRRLPLYVVKLPLA